MKKIDDTIVRETKYIAVWVIILSAVMEAVFLIIGKWNYTILLGNLFGGIVAVVNFLLMGMTVQRAIAGSEKDASTLMKFSQTMRTIFLFVSAILAISLPFFNGAAAIIPLFFPRIAIAFVPLRDKQKLKTEVKNNGE